MDRLDLIRLANRLDATGRYVEADVIDVIIRCAYKMAPDRYSIPDVGERHWSLYQEMTDRVGQDRMYDAFRESYEKSTGAAWDRSKFDNRSRGWIYFGDENGYIAIRPQASGIWKLAGVAGKKKSIYRAFKQVNEESYPIWGVVTDDIKHMMAKASSGNFSTPPGIIVSALANKIPPEVLGGAEVKGVSPITGAMKMDVPGIGEMSKFYIANRAYWSWLADQAASSGPSIFSGIPGPLKSMMEKALFKLTGGKGEKDALESEEWIESYDQEESSGESGEE